MIISKLTLFRLPVDVNYENVFDEWATYDDRSTSKTVVMQRLVSSLQSMYASYELTLSENRSIKEIDGKSILTLPFDYIWTKNFNYVFVESYSAAGGIQVIGYFITNYESQNDNVAEGKASTTISLEYDVWTNNYYDFAVKNIYNEETVIQERHFQRWSIQNYPTVSLTQLPTPRTAISHSSQYKYRAEPTILWYVFLTNCLVDNIDGLAFGSPHSDFSTFYYPYGAYYKGKFYNVELTYSSVSEQITIKSKTLQIESGASIFNWVKPNPLNIVAENETAYIEGCGITSLAPTEYSGIRINDDTATITAGITKKPNYVYRYNVRFDNFSEQKRITNGKCIVWNVGDKVSYWTRLSQTHYSADFPRTSINDLLVNGRYSEPIFEFYPYKYYSAIIAGKTPIILSNGTPSSNWTITRDVQPLGVVDTVKIGAPQYEAKYPSQLQFNSPHYVSAKSQFLRDNSARFLIQHTDNLIPSISFSKAQNAKTALNMGTNVLKNYLSASATMSDLENQKGLLEMPADMAEINAFFSDDIVVKEYSMTSLENMLAELQLCRTNGYLLETRDSVFKNERVFFDYCRAEDFNTSIITARSEREKLKSIFRNGVRKWHIPYLKKTYSNLNSSKAREFNYDVPNPERGFVDEGYIT